MNCENVGITKLEFVVKTQFLFETNKNLLFVRVMPAFIPPKNRGNISSAGKTVTNKKCP